MLILFYILNFSYVILGFPRPWCEVALRRSRYNVEMAINLCFEAGPEIEQLVAEEEVQRNAARAGDRGRGGTTTTTTNSSSSSIIIIIYIEAQYVTDNHFDFMQIL